MLVFALCRADTDYSAAAVSVQWGQKLCPVRKDLHVALLCYGSSKAKLNIRPQTYSFHPQITQLFPHIFCFAILISISQANISGLFYPETLSCLPVEFLRLSWKNVCPATPVRQ